MYREIQAKVLLSHVPHPDNWFGLKYSMNLYRGCQHQCIYCDSRSTCYQIKDFREILVKANAIELLEEELSHKRVKGTIGTSSMNDPYMPLESKLNLTGQALEVIARHRFPVHIITKSDLVLKDLETLKEIHQVYAAISFTITTADDSLAKKLEPGAPPVSARFRAMEALSKEGIRTGVTMMPILPFIEDTQENITAIVLQAKAAGASYMIPAFGMTLRSGSREYYYAQLERLFPGMRQRYERAFGGRYFCAARQAHRLAKDFAALCEQHGLATSIIGYQKEAVEQLSFF